MNKPIRTNKEDRYFSEQPQSTSTLTQSFFMNKKLIIIIMAIIIVALLLIIFLMATGRSPQDEIRNNALNAGGGQVSNNRGYQTLNPPNHISSNSTFTDVDLSYGTERIQIPDDITEHMSQYYNANGSLIEFNGENTDVDFEHNELPLGKTIQNNHYTIQLIATSSLESMMAFVKSSKLANYQIYETRRENKPWFVLIKGEFASIKDAKTVIQYLSADLQRNSPWVKSGTVVNKEKQVLQ